MTESSGIFSVLDSLLAELSGTGISISVAWVCLSSKAEGLPNVIIEAMVCRTPVIASNCKSGIGELCLNGKGGFLYKPGDKEALCQALMDFNKTPEAVKEHVENAQKQLDRFKIENIIPKVEALIDG